MLPVEVRYLDLVWSDPETVLKLEYSREPLEVVKTASGWLVETTTFPSVYHYIGVRVTDDSLSHIPYFELADGSRQELLPVKVPGKEENWWIQSSGWFEKGKRYHSELYRTTGSASLVIQNQLLTLENNTFNFSVKELEYYLSDFENSLWMLILEDTSVLKSNVSKEIPDYFNDEVLNLFHGFIDSVEKVIEKPGMYLSETSGKRPIRAVKPVPRTFREYATKPFVKELTSRTYRETYDTMENRYVHYCVKRVRYILKSFMQVAGAQIRACEQKMEQERAWREQLQETQIKVIDSRVYDNEILKLEEDVIKLKRKFSKLATGTLEHSNLNRSLQHGSYDLQLGAEYGNSGSAFFANRLNGKDFRERYGTYLVVKLPPYTQVSELQPDLARSELSIKGSYIKSKERNSKDNQYFQLQFDEISAVSLLAHPLLDQLTQLRERRKTLEANDWLTQYSAQELEERAIEREVADRKTSYLVEALEKIASFNSALPTLARRISKVELFFIESKVKQQSDCPNSMTFVQNPSYASTKSVYRKISSINGLDESILSSLMAIDEIGLVNISNLYEKWCLLQIIKVLTKVYGFRTEADWQRDLISSALSRRVDIEFRLSHQKRKQVIVLTYEKVLDSGKRPDYVLDLYTDYQDGRYSRLIIDAKFRGEMNDNDLYELVRNLYEEKNYSEDGANQVFVMHPTPNVINDRTSPLDWGTQCDYGQSHEIDHKYGGIFVSPSLKHFRTTEHLQRLLGMFLQQNSIVTTQEDSNHPEWHNICCISCGSSDHENLQLTYEPTKAGNERWLIRCNDCSLLTIQTICASCHHKIFKNGPKWTYHRTRADQLSNVVCPQCESFL
jgi:hypothetical protein